MSGAMPRRAGLAGSASRRHGDVVKAAGGALALMLALTAPALAGTALPADLPRRVVSMNLCTDQLALMLAAPGQVVSVSYMAQDARESVMSEAALTLPANHQQAEEIFFMHPDLVLTGTYSTRETADLLRRLGVRVETFAPEASLDDIRANITRMGVLLGREAAAAAMVARFDADLARLHPATGSQPRAALYYANGYTSGSRTLAGQILASAGFANIADEAGLPVGGNLALEQLILLNPDTIITGRHYPAASRAEEILDHPALKALTAGRPGGALTDRDWVCGTPAVLNAVADLAALRQRIEDR